MEKNGLKPLPVFHYGEDIEWLQLILSKKYDYICLGGMVKTPKVIFWLDDIWNNYLTDKDGMPLCKVHGFGQTSLKLMLRYPWFSVDSTSWVITGRLGGIYIPQRKNNYWIYDENSWKIAVSNKSPNRKEAGKHFDTLTKWEKQIVLQYLEEKGYIIGKSEFKKESQSYALKENEKWADKKPKDKTAKREVEIIIEPGLCNAYQLRDELNIIYFMDLEKNMPQWPWKLKKEKILKSLF
jgi:hypothetical protein